MAARKEVFFIHEHSHNDVATTAMNLSNMSWSMFRRFIRDAVPSKFRQEQGTGGSIVEITVVEDDPFVKRQLIVRQGFETKFVATYHDSQELVVHEATEDDWTLMFANIAAQTAPEPDSDSDTAEPADDE